MEEIEFIPLAFQNKKRPPLFLDAIESSWRGNERFVSHLVKLLKPKTIVDLGFDRGLSTISLGCTKQAEVFAVDWFNEKSYAAKCFALDAAFQNISKALRAKYAYNIHLIIGSFEEIARTWKEPVDILHIDCLYTYQALKSCLDVWTPFLEMDAVVLIHNVTAYSQEVGRLFESLELDKFIFPSRQGLGVFSLSPKRLQSVKELLLTVQ